MGQKEIVICNPVRTAIGTYGGSLKDIPAPDLGAVVVREVLKRSGLQADKVQTLVMGNVIQAGVKMNPARQAGIAAGLPVEVPALTVNRVCGSGAQGIVSAALEIWSGMVDCAMAGGMENMDRAPYLLPQGRWGARMGDVTMFDSMLYDGLNDAFSGKHSGWHTEDLVTQKNISREDQDRWALRSQQRFAAAQAAGQFEAEIVAVEVPGRKGPTVFNKDEHNRPETTTESLAKLKPAFRKDGTITAGSAPGLNSGAAAMIVADREWAEKNGLHPLARLVSYGVGAVEPGMFGLGPRCLPSAKHWHGRSGRLPMLIALRSMKPSPRSHWPVYVNSGLPRTLSMSRGAPLHMGTPSVPLARYSQRVWCIPCSAMAASVALSRCALAVVKASRWRWKCCEDKHGPTRTSFS